MIFQRFYKVLVYKISLIKLGSVSSDQADVDYMIFSSKTMYQEGKHEEENDWSCQTVKNLHLSLQDVK